MVPNQRLGNSPAPRSTASNACLIRVPNAAPAPIRARCRARSNGAARAPPSMLNSVPAVPVAAKPVLPSPSPSRYPSCPPHQIIKYTGILLGGFLIGLVPQTPGGRIRSLGCLVLTRAGNRPCRNAGRIPGGGAVWPDIWEQPGGDKS
jgi:hypothetical protein